MTLPPLAEVSDLAAWVGQTIESADPRAGAVLSAASALIRSHAGQTWTDTAVEIPEAVRAITVQVAARVWLNPAGLTSVTVDDATRRWGVSGVAGLYLTDQEKEALSPFTVGAPTGLGTMSTTRGSLGTGDTIYVPTGPAPSGPPFPWYSAEDFR